MKKRTPTADISEFATKYKLQKPRIDLDGSLVIFGKSGQIYEHCDTEAGGNLPQPQGQDFRTMEQGAHGL